MGIVLFSKDTSQEIHHESLPRGILTVRESFGEIISHGALHVGMPTGMLTFLGGVFQLYLDSDNKSEAGRRAGMTRSKEAELDSNLWAAAVRNICICARPGEPDTEVNPHTRVSNVC